MPLPTTGLTVHCYAGAATNLFMDVNGGGAGVHTGTPGDGDRVEAWTEESDSGVTDFVAAEGTNPPTYRVNTPLMGLPCIDFDGTNDRFICFPNVASGVFDYVDLCANNAKTVIFAFYPESIAGTDTSNIHLNDSIWCDRTETCGFYLYDDSGTKKFAWLNKDGVTSRDVITTVITTGASWIAVARHDGTDLMLTMIDEDGNEDTPANVASGNTQSMGGEVRIGGAPAGGLLYNGRIGEFAFWNVVLTGTDLQDAKDHFIDNWATGAGGNAVPVKMASYRRRRVA